MTADKPTAHPDGAGPGRADAALQPFEKALRERFASSDDLIAEARVQVERRARRTRAARRAAVGTSVVGMLLAALVWFDPAWSTQEWHTAVGERQNVALASGDQLMLDSGSRVRVDRHLRTRQITIARGEVLVTATPAWQPLVVHADGARVVDIGTVFSVRLDHSPNDGAGVLQVTVLQGAVAVDAGAGPASRGSPMTVAAGQTLALVQQGTLFDEAAWSRGTAVAADVDRLLAWRRGRLVFDGTPLAQAVTQMQRYRPFPIRIVDPRIAGLRLSGEADTADIDALLDTLPAKLHVTLQRSADGSVDLRGR